MIKKCSFAKKLSSYVDGELATKESELIRRHLQSCSFCQNELNRLESVDRMISGIRNIEPSYQFDPSFWRKIHSLKETKRKTWSFNDIILWGVKPALTGAVVVALIATATMIYVDKFTQRGNPPEIALVEDFEFYSDLDIVSQLDLLENWDEIMTIRERS
jgi:anti-sigma factor RsiW